MNADEFLAWVQTVPKDAGRFELIDGRVVERLQAEKIGHTDAKGELFALFREALKRLAPNRQPCRAYVDGATVRVSMSRSFRPDGLLRCGEPISTDSLEINDPVLVYEVLSPSTWGSDMSTKLEAYLSVASIQHYLIVDTDRSVVIHHRRTDAQTWQTRILHGGQSLVIDPPGITIDVAAIFA